MRHRWAGRKLGRDSSHRKAMLRNLVTSLFKYEQLETTDAKAKELRPLAEKMITLAKRGDLHARRQALAYMKDKTVTHRLFEELKDRYLDRSGGYVRIIKKGNRKGDGAPISVMQLIPAEEGKKKAKKKTKSAKSPSAAGAKKAKEAKVKKADKEQAKEEKAEAKPSGREKKKETKVKKAEKAGPEKEQAEEEKTEVKSSGRKRKKETK